MSFISYADDFMVSSDDDETDSLWDDTGEALKDTGLDTNGAGEISTL